MKTPETKRKLVAKFAELRMMDGYSIEDLIFRPSTYFDYDKLALSVLIKYAKHESDDSFILGFFEYIEINNLLPNFDYRFLLKTYRK